MSSNSTTDVTNTMPKHEHAVEKEVISVPPPPPPFSYTSLTQTQRELIDTTFHVITNEEGVPLTSEMFEQTIHFRKPNRLTYTPNSRDLGWGEKKLENGTWSVIYYRNSTSYYLYRTLTGDYWMIGFIDGKLNSSSPYTFQIH